MITSFVARGMAATLLRKSSNEEFQSPGWARLQQHLAKHKAAGGIVCVKRRLTPKPLIVDGYWCVELVDVEAFDPARII